MNLNSISTWLQEMFKTEASQSEGMLDEKGVVNLVTKLNNNIAPARVQQKVKVSAVHTHQNHKPLPLMLMLYLIRLVIGKLPQRPYTETRECP